MFLLSFALALVNSSCGDRDLDDYQRDRAAEEITRINAIAGIYDGGLIRSADGADLGHLILELQPETRINLPSDKVSAQQQITLKGNLELNDGKYKFLSFSGAYFDSSTNNFQASVTLELGDSTLKSGFELVMAGRLNGGSVEGTIEVRGFPESRTQFKLQRSQNQSVRPVRSFGNESTQPTGTTWDRWEATKIEPPNEFEHRSFLKIRELDTSSDIEFFQVFAPIKSVDAVLFFTDRVAGAFPNARWDLRTGRLHGESKITINGGEIRNLVLDCISVIDKRGHTGWNCMYSNNAAGVTMNFEFRKAE